MQNSSTENKIKTTQLLVSGLIQGVGFRPFIYRLAKSLELNGKVYNQNNGVVVLLQGDELVIEKFRKLLTTELPAAAEIISIRSELFYDSTYSNFSIETSQTVDDTITQVSADIAVCENCLEEMKHQPHRLDYPFINCTNCGPRFSIIENIPYDRPFTSMKDFKMCPECKKEYSDVNDRRFHAQPVACNHCGPFYKYFTADDSITDFKSVRLKVKRDMETGKVIAIKGIGGFHLACDALNPVAIDNLRQIKKRDGKPFALMVKDIETAKKYAQLTDKEIHALSSWQRPILLVDQKVPQRLSDKITNGLKTIGIFLPYMPFHYQLFEITGKDILLMTSANFSDCPIIIDNKEALETFLPKGIPVLVHNREIVNRVDDSIVQYDALGLRIIRRSRGYTPRPVTLKPDVEGILAVGAELTGAFCIGRQNQAILSQYIGDIKNSETLEFYEQSYKTMKKLFRFSPKIVACDLHPDYLSTTFAKNLGIPLVYTQHHHAHVAACMAEYGLDEPVIGVAYDGTGYGTDGKIWGSEIMVATLADFDRKFHFEYVPVPGGDKATEEPWRSGYAYVFNAFSGLFPPNIKLFKDIPENQIKLIDIALNKKINSPESCSAGRLFDAVAALLGICTFSTYHAEAPLKLEHAVASNINECYTIDLKSKISWNCVILQIISDIEKQIDKGIIAAKFHNTVADITFRAILELSAKTGISKVILTGGTFQNKYLVKKIVDLFINTGIQLFMPSQLPSNDGGIALGQMVIAAKTRIMC